MIIGVPKEIKTLENRVALVPVGAELMTHNKHKVYVEKNAGIGSGFTDEDYKAAGATILDTPEEIFEITEMIMKVKEPLPQEYDLIRENQIVFTYFHFAASQELTDGILK